MEGFFTRTELEQVTKPHATIPQCGRCGLYKKCKSPKMRVMGEGRRKILIIGEMPGQKDDESGKCFTGNDGVYLRSSLRKFGVDMARDCWMTNALICHPKNNYVKDSQAVEYCRPNIVNAISEFNPEIIIPLGELAVKSVVGWVWKENAGEIEKWIGWRIPHQKLNAWICPNFAPSEVIKENKRLEEMAFLKTLKASVSSKLTRPYSMKPDYKKHIQVIRDPEHAAKIIRALMMKDMPLAFDYETNMLKPDSQAARIVCCAVSDGQTAVAFPFYGEARKAMKRLVKSGIPLVAANLKFEDRWTRKILKCRVKKWHHDTVLGAHTLDHRAGTTGLKFQAFVTLGQDSYNDHIEPFLKAKGANEMNRIKEVPLDELLMYCGMDALLEHKLMVKQRRSLGYE